MCTGAHGLVRGPWPCRRTYLARVPTREINEGWAAYVRKRMDDMKVSGPSDLARRSGVDQSVISRWLNEGRTPTVDALRRLAKPLDTSLLELMVAAGHLTREEADAEERRVQEELPVGRSPQGGAALPLEGLTAEQLAEVRRYAEYIRSQNPEAR